MTNRKNGTLYVGVTADLPRRASEHRTGAVKGFTKRWGLRCLVHVEPYDDILDAIHREECIKEWRRDWKIQLIEKENPRWRDLYEDFAAHF